MDYLYRNELPADADPLGSSIFAVITRAFTSMSVHYRRQSLRSLIDDTVALETKDRAYMELFMDWNLIYRDEEQMLAIARDAGERCCAVFSTRTATWGISRWRMPSTRSANPQRPARLRVLRPLRATA